MFEFILIALALIAAGFTAAVLDSNSQDIERNEYLATIETQANRARLEIARLNDVLISINKEMTRSGREIAKAKRIGSSVTVRTQLLNDSANRWREIAARRDELKERFNTLTAIVDHA